MTMFADRRDLGQKSRVQQVDFLLAWPSSCSNKNTNRITFAGRNRPNLGLDVLIRGQAYQMLVIWDLMPAAFTFNRPIEALSTNTFD